MVRSLLTAVAAAIGTIRDATPLWPRARTKHGASRLDRNFVLKSCPVDLSRIIKYAPATSSAELPNSHAFGDAWMSPPGRIAASAHPTSSRSAARGIPR